MFLLDAIDGFLKRSAEIAESASAIVGDLRGADVNLDEVKQLAARTPRIVEALGRLTESQALDRVPDVVNAVTGLAESGMLDPKLVKLLSEVGHRLGAHKARPPRSRPLRLARWGCSGRSASRKCSGPWECWSWWPGGSAAIYTDQACTSCRSPKVSSVSSSSSCPRA